MANTLSDRVAAELIAHLFTQPVTRERHMSAPFLSERIQYIAFRREQGKSRGDLRRDAAVLLDVVVLLNITGRDRIGEDEIRRANQRWAQRAKRHSCRIRGPSRSFSRVARGFLRFRGMLAKEILPYGDILDEYCRFLSGLKAFAPLTVENYRYVVSTFLRWFASEHLAFDAITISDVQEFFLELWRVTLKPASIAKFSTILRSFFQFTEAQRITPGLISAGIANPTLRRKKPEPRGPSWKDVKKMLTARTDNSPHSLRMLAVIFLMAIYGLRAIEVCSLRLSDIDWEARIMTVKRAKGGRTQRFPLRKDLANVLVQYIQNERPGCPLESVFVTAVRPYRPVTPYVLRHIVMARMDALHIESSIRGPHALRHSCATELLERGIAWHEIGRFLGQKTCDAVGVYAKSSKASLRAVANFHLDIPL
jgi:site-specific recombinase XerD